MREKLRAVAIGICCGALSAPSLAAQALSSGTAAQCTDAAAESDLRRVNGYLRSDVADSALAVEVPANLLTEMLAHRVRALLGAAEGPLATAEPAFTRSSIDGSLRVTLYRDGRVRSAVQPDTSDKDSLRVGGVRVLASLLGKSLEAGDRYQWPDSAPGDSAQFRIEFEVPMARPNGPATQPDSGFVVPVFKIALPWQEPAAVAKLVSPKFPTPNLNSLVTGTIHLEFVIDTTGFAIRSSIREMLPGGYAKPTGKMAVYYRYFVNAAKDAVAATSYSPLRIAGCKAPGLVIQPFEFAFR